jgi:hypothetical protein
VGVGRLAVRVADNEDKREPGRPAGKPLWRQYGAMMPRTARGKTVMRCLFRSSLFFPSVLRLKIYWDLDSKCLQSKMHACMATTNKCEQDAEIGRYRTHSILDMLAEEVVELIRHLLPRQDVGQVLHKHHARLRLELELE